LAARRSIDTVELGAALLLLGGVVLSGWLFLAFLLGTIEFLLAAPDMGNGVVVLNCGVLGYLFASLVRRLLRRDFAWPRPRLVLANALVGYGCGWGIGVAIIAAGAVSEALLNFGAPPKNGSYFADALFFILVASLVSLPGVFTLILGLLLRRQ
jgi:hypothetical protein